MDNNNKPKPSFKDVCSKIRINAVIAVALLTAVVIIVILHTDMSNPPSHFWGIIGSYVTGVSMLSTKLVEKD